MIRTKISTIALAVVSLFFVACDDTTDSIGSSLVDYMDKLHVSADTFNVSSRTILADSVLSNNSIGYLGRVKDPETGDIVTGQFMSQFHAQTMFTLPDENLIMSKDNGKVIADSCDVYLYYTSYYGDTLAPMKVTVHEMDKPMEESATYYSTFNPLKEGYVRTGGLKQSRSYTLTDFTKPDSVLYASGYNKNIRISLDHPYTDKAGNTYNNYGTYLLREYYKNPENFRNSYRLTHNVAPGLFYSIDGGIGSMAYITTARLNIYFSYQGDSTVETGITSLSSTEEVLQSTTFSYDANKLATLADDNTCTYLKTPAGLYTELTLPVEEILKNHENDSINTAKISLKRLNNTSTSQYNLPVPQTLLILPKDSLHSFFAKNKVADYETSFLATFSANSSTNSYVFNNISGIINAMAKAKASGKASSNWNKVVIVPVTTSYSSDSYGSNVLTRVSYDMSMTNTKLMGGAANPYQPLTISIIYSKFNGR